MLHGYCHPRFIAYPRLIAWRMPDLSPNTRIAESRRAADQDQPDVVRAAADKSGIAPALCLSPQYAHTLVPTGSERREDWSCFRVPSGTRGWLRHIEPDRNEDFPTENAPRQGWDRASRLL